MTFAEADRGPEIPRLERIERKVLIMKDRSRRNEGSRQRGRSVGLDREHKPGIFWDYESATIMVSPTSRN